MELSILRGHLGSLLAGTHEAFRWNAVSFLSLFLILGAVFLPAFVVPYASHDQYRHFTDPLGRAGFKLSCHNDPYYPAIFQLGRPLAAMGECLVFEHASRLSDLNVLRLWVLVVMALAAAGYAAVLRNCGLGGVVSILLTAAIFTLPAAQAGIFMTSFAVVGFSVLTATIAHTALRRANAKYTANRYLSAVFLTATAGLLLMAALLTYQFLALFFLAATMAYLLFEQGQSWREKVWLVLRDITFFTLVAGAYWWVAKLWLFPRNQAILPAAYRSNLVLGGIPSKFAHFISQELPGLLALWYLYPHPVLTVGIILLISVGVGLYLWRGGERNGQRWDPTRLVTGAGIIVLLMASIGPYLASSAFFLYRIFFVPGSLIVLLLYWSATQIVSLAPLPRAFPLRNAMVWVAGTICAAGCCLAARSTILNITNSSIELAFIEKQLAAASIGSDTARVHVIRPREIGLGFNGHPSLTDEFNRPSTAYSFDITSMVRTAIIEMDKQSKFVVDGHDWLAAAQKRTVCSIRWVGPGELRIVSGDGSPTNATIRGDRIEVPAWKLAGTLTLDGMAIQWSDLTVWGRRYQRVPHEGADTESAVEGEWTIFDRYPDNKLVVTSSAPGEQVPVSPRWIVIDMNLLLNSVREPPPWDPSNIAAPRHGMRAFASSHQTGYGVEALNDGTPLPWGSANVTDDTYFGLEFPSREAIRLIRITAFSPSHRAHLREISVVTADSLPPPDGNWTIVRSRVRGSESFANKVVVPPVDDNGLIVIEVDPHDPNAKAHGIWALACLPGYSRNYLTQGPGVYVREVEMVSAADAH